MEHRRNRWKPPSELKADKEAGKADAVSIERERRLAIKTLVRSPEYQYLVNEAVQIAGRSAKPTDGNSLIAYVSDSLRRDAIYELLDRLETLASEIPEPIRITTRKTER